MSGSDWVWLGLTGSEWVWLGLDGSIWVRRSSWVWLGLAECGWVWLGLAESGWVWMGLDGSDWVELFIYDRAKFVKSAEKFALEFRYLAAGIKQTLCAIGLLSYNSVILSNFLEFLNFTPDYIAQLSVIPITRISFRTEEVKYLTNRDIASPRDNAAVTVMLENAEAFQAAGLRGESLSVE